MTENRRGPTAPLTPAEKDMIGALHLLGGLKEILLAVSIASEAPNEHYNPTSGLFVTLVGMVGQIAERVNAYMVETMGDPATPAVGAAE